MTLDYVKSFDFKKEMTEDDIKSFVKDLSETNNDNDEVCTILLYLVDEEYRLCDKELKTNVNYILKSQDLRKFWILMMDNKEKYNIGTEF